MVRHTAAKHSTALTCTTAATAAPLLSIYWVVIYRSGISSGCTSGISCSWCGVRWFVGCRARTCGVGGTAFTLAFHNCRVPRVDLQYCRNCRFIESVLRRLHIWSIQHNRRACILDRGFLRTGITCDSLLDIQTAVEAGAFTKLRILDLVYCLHSDNVGTTIVGDSYNDIFPAV